jgi:nucleotidyltransferase substrate binding protein (TIGR01987 family)
MERVAERLETARRALETLGAVLREPKNEITRDASIQRFQYTFEAVWKAAQISLKRLEGLDTASPKGAIRLGFQAGWLSEAQAHLAMQMVEDRNRTVHTYVEELAEEIYGRLPGYTALMKGWLESMEQRAGH